jgi:hypothetical protein
MWPIGWVDFGTSSRVVGYHEKERTPEERKVFFNISLAERSWSTQVIQYIAVF